MDKLEKGKNFRVEGSLDSDAVSKDGPKGNQSDELLKESQKDFNLETPSGINPAEKIAEDIDEEMKRSSTENGNGSSVSNP